MRHFLLTFSALCLTLFSFAQKNKNFKAKLNEDTIVRDTLGNAYPYDIWKRFAFNSNYTLYPVDPSSENSEFIIKRLSVEERKQQMEKLPKPPQTKYFKTGASFSAFKEKDIEGHKYNLKEMKGKVVVLNYWFIACPPCQMEIPELNILVEDYKNNQDVVFIGIALDSKNDLKEFLRTMPFNYNIIGNGRLLAQSDGIKSFPTHVVIDKDGKVKFHTSGLSKNTVYWVKKSIEEALVVPITKETDIVQQ